MAETYNLTTLLVTIVASSASFVAILGGFIASKLLAISGERDHLENQIVDLQSKIELKTARNRKLWYDLDEDKALCFILAHPRDLYDQVRAEDVLKKYDESDIDLESFKPFWDKGLALRKKIITAYHNGEACNENNIPLSMLEEFRQDYFLQKVANALTEEYRSEVIRQQLLSRGMPRIETVPLQPTQNLYSIMPKEWKKTHYSEIKELNKDLDLLELQKGLVEEQLKKLFNPPHVNSGLVIFGLFSLFNIIVPLLLCMWEYPAKNSWYYLVQYSTISLFAIGLLVVLLYMKSVLNRKSVS